MSATTHVATDAAFDDPARFVAVTTTRSVFPRRSSGRRRRGRSHRFTYRLRQLWTSSANGLAFQPSMQSAWPE